MIAKAEHVPALVKLLTSTKDGGVRGEAENAVVAAAATTEAGKNPAEPVLAAVPGAGSPEVRASLLRVLGRIAHASALPVLYQSAQDADAGVKDAAIRALAEWPTGEPAAVLFGIASDASASQVHRVLALRGYVVMITKQRTPPTIRSWTTTPRRCSWRAATRTSNWFCPNWAWSGTAGRWKWLGNGPPTRP